jgi:predicted peroxiredoxin
MRPDRSEEEAMKVLYLSTSGARDPTKASLPLHLAVNGSLEAGQEAAVVLAGDGADLVVGNNAASIEGVGLPPARELVAKLRDNSVPVYV